MNPIGVFGGTFDPIHLGHIQPVLDVCQATGISEVRYIPNYRPGHRSQPRTDAKHRWKMTQLALEGYDELIADDREIRRAGVSYMVPTLCSLRSEFLMRPLSLILGIDAFLQIHRWYWWANVLKLSNIVVMDRPGSRIPHRLPDWWLRALCDNSRVLFERMSGSVVHVMVDRVGISATEVRKALQRGDCLAGTLSDNVLDYIGQHNLYQLSGGKS